MSTATKHSRPHQDAEESPGILDQVIDKTQESLPPELMAIRMEKQMIMAECKARPRDMEKIKAKLMADLKAFPDLADASIYCKPCGKDKDTGKEKFAEDLSIRAAETLAEAYGYNEVSIEIFELGDDKVKVEARCFDYQTVRIWRDAGILSKWYKSSRGGMTKIPDDRFYNLTCKAEGSRRAREAILRIVNSGLKAWYKDTCYKIIDRMMSPEKIQHLIDQFASIGVTQGQLERVVGRPVSLGWTAVDHRLLHGIWNAIKDNQTTVAEAFARPEQNTPPPTAVGGATIEDLTGGSRATPAPTSEPGTSESPPFSPPTPAEVAVAEADEQADTSDPPAAQPDQQALEADALEQEYADLMRRAYPKELSDLWDRVAEEKRFSEAAKSRLAKVCAARKKEMAADSGGGKQTQRRAFGNDAGG